MRKDRLYFYTFLALAGIFIIIGLITVNFFIKESTHQLLTTQLESSRREAKEVAFILGHELANGVEKEKIIENVQTSIKNSNSNTFYLSIFDWSSTIISHPDIKRIGQKSVDDQSFVSSVDGEVTSDDLYTFFIEKKESNEINKFENDIETSEIIYQYPISNSDLIIGAHANLTKIEKQTDDLRNRFYSIFSIMGFIITLSSVITVRFLGSKYEKKIESEKGKLEDEVINLAKLNTALGEYQQKVSIDLSKTKEEDNNEVSKDEKVEEKTKKESGKKRILTYLRNELLSIATEDIAYIYTENTITYVIDVQGKRSTTNQSLDELFSGLDNAYFYRANRQFIIAISSIDKIIKYGNNQLKILVAPKSEVDVIIGKNKAAEFKQWLNS
ncbi:LytR/AlgR family response regulator transcription factor [uncultured Croceitalea sp.]|uniref:LytR/AlgR family response regulator transcription factor n=1 Tax=uncultured Croceitalea sp. TaxID=1798908 RepID=UPI00374F5915